MVHVANEAPQMGSQVTTLLLRQKRSYLVSPAMGLDDELAAVEGRFRAADSNPRPVAREHDASRSATRVLDHNFALGNVDRFVLVASLHIRVQRPGEQAHLRPSEGQHGPVTEEGRSP